MYSTPVPPLKSNTDLPPKLSPHGLRAVGEFLESLDTPRVLGAMAQGARHGWAREALAGRNTRAEVSGIAPATVDVRLRDGVQSVPALEVVVSTNAMHRRQAKRLRVRVFSLDGHTLRVHTCAAAK